MRKDLLTGGQAETETMNPIVPFLDVLRTRLKATFNGLPVLQIFCTECTQVSLESCCFYDMLKQA